MNCKCYKIFLNSYRTRELYRTLIFRAMKEYTMPPEGSPSAIDFEQEFGQTIRHGNKVQVTKFERIKVLVCHNHIVYYLAGLPCNSSGVFHQLLYSRIPLFLWTEAPLEWKALFWKSVLNFHLFRIPIYFELKFYFFIA